MCDCLRSVGRSFFSDVSFATCPQSLDTSYLDEMLAFEHRFETNCVASKPKLCAFHICQIRLNNKFYRALLMFRA